MKSHVKRTLATGAAVAMTTGLAATLLATPPATASEGAGYGTKVEQEITGFQASLAIGRFYTMKHNQHRYNVRAGRGAGYRLVTTVRGKGKSLPCWYNYCRGVKKGGVYRCKAGSEKSNLWIPLRFKGRKVWAGENCGALGR